MSMFNDINRANRLLRRAIVNQIFDGDEGATSREGIIGLLDQDFLLVQVPVMQDIRHGDDIGLRQLIRKEVAGYDGDAICHSGRIDMFLRLRRDG
jgi:hypothetical protein